MKRDLDLEPFEEVQRLAGTPIALLVGGPIVPLVGLMLLADAPIAAIALVLLAPALILLIFMHTRVTRDGVRIAYPPLGWKRIEAERIESAEAVTYSPLADYGGWGPYRMSWRRGMPPAWTVWGNTGVIVRTKDGKDVLIGSKKPEELAEAIGALVGDKPGTLVAGTSAAGGQGGG